MPPPDGSDDGADDEVPGPHLVGELLQVVIAGVDIDVRREEEQIDAVELDAIDVGLRGESIMVSRSMNGSASAEPLPTTPGQAALWSLG